MHLVENYHHRTESGTSKEVLYAWDVKVKLFKKSLNKKGGIAKENRE